MKYRIIIFVISLMALAILYGCGSHGSGVRVNPSGDRNITSREGVIDEQGRLQTLTFASGAKIEALEEKTLFPGIKVTVTEESLTSTSGNKGYFSDYNPIFILYRITAFQSLANSAGSKTYVTTTEKPFKITFPTLQASQNLNFIGIKESDSDPWRYFSLSNDSEILANMAGVRLAGANTKNYSISLFRLGTQLAFLSFDDNDKSKLPESIVTGLTASSTPSIAVENGKYCEDLKIKGFLKGRNLDSINPTDLRARITYRNSQADEADIKVNGVNVMQKNKADKTVPGSSYFHTFEVESISGYNLNGSNGDFSFILNLNGVETSSFPTGFLIEFYNKITNDKILPYIYSEFYTLPEKEAVDVVITPDRDSTSVDGSYELNPTFTITIGKELSDSDKQKVEEAITVLGVDLGNIIKTWEVDKLKIGFEEDLEPGKTYTLKIDDVTDIEGISIKDVEDLTFKTKDSDSPKSSYSITYNLDGGSVTPPNPTGYNSASETFTLTNPTKNGYEFIGWTGTGLDTASKTLFVVKGCKSNLSFTANYVPITYNITYILDEGVFATPNPTSYDITSSTIVLNNPTKNNFRFVGWTGSNGDTPQTTVIIDEGSTGNKTYIANYTAANYVITYNLDGGTVTPPNPTGYNTASETFVLTNPTKNGYEFIGWTGTGLDTASKTLSVVQGCESDLSFTANYAPITYNIAYTLNEGVLATNNPTSYDVTSATIILNNPTKEGYTFTGWTGSNGNTPQPVAIIEKGSYGNKSFTANWSVNSYKLTLNKGTGIAEVIGENMYQYGSAVTASCTMVDGYEFDFWTGNNGVAVFNMPAKDVEMQANARLKTFSITCNLNGGTVSAPNRTSYNLISEDINIVNPTREGYTFEGWTGSNGDDPQINITINTGSTGDKTYNANWSLITYSIEYFLSGGTLVGENPESYNVTTADFVLVNPTKDEFRFVGWTGSNGDEPELTVTVETGSTGDRQYNANFVQAANIINYNLNGGTNHPDNPHGFNPASATFTIYPATKLGYAFLGWTGSNGDNPEMSVTIESGTQGDLNFTANFEAVPYTISYLLYGGTNNPLNPIGYAVHTPTFTLYEPTRPGYAFVGWTEGTATFPLILTEVPVGSTGDKVFYAHWIESKTFYLPGGVPLVMHKIPHGTFTMGSPNEELGRDYDDFALRESPQHQVTLTKDFYIGKFEVTQEQYMAVMQSNPANFSEYADSTSRPVESVSWNDANTFCASLTNYLSAQIPDGFTGFGLPTEAQWEYACRGGTTSSLNNGTEITASTGKCDNLSVLAWYSSTATSQTHVVGQKQSNAWGLYDMHGNVWEWCRDRYDKTYYQTCGDCTDPEGPSSSVTSRVLRGGSWGSHPQSCRSAPRYGHSLSYTNNSVGFRVILVSTP